MNNEQAIKEPFSSSPSGGFVVTDDADEIIKSCVSRVIRTIATDESGTLIGEYPWDGEIGSHVELARHKDQLVLGDLISAFIQEPLALYVPEVAVTSVIVERIDRMTYNVVALYTRNGKKEKLPFTVKE